MTATSQEPAEAIWGLPEASWGHCLLVSLLICSDPWKKAIRPLFSVSSLLPCSYRGPSLAQELPGCPCTMLAAPVSHLFLNGAYCLLNALLGHSPRPRHCADLFAHCPMSSHGAAPPEWRGSLRGAFWALAVASDSRLHARYSPKTHRTIANWLYSQRVIT